MCEENNEILYHHMSVEESENFKRNKCIFLKQASSWNDDDNRWEDPFLEKLKIVGNKDFNYEKQLKSIKELIYIYLSVYNNAFNIYPVMNQFNAWENEKIFCYPENQQKKFTPRYFYDVFTDVLNYVAIAYNTFVSSWTKSEESVGIGSKVDRIKIKKDNLLKLQKDGYKIELCKMQYCNLEELTMEKRIRRMINKKEKNIDLKSLLLELPEELYGGEEEYRLILLPKVADFSNSISFSKYANGKSSNMDEFARAILDSVKKIKEYFDENYKNDRYGNIIELHIPEEYIEK